MRSASAATLFALLLGLAACACGGQETVPQPPAGDSPATHAGAIGAVRADGNAQPERPGDSTTPRTEAATRDLEAAATLRQSSHLFVERDVSVLTRRQGIVRQVTAQRGERVRSGQILCSLENRDLALALEVAKLQTEKARSEFERADRLDRESAISREAWEEAQFKLRSAERAEQIAAQELEKTLVRAPFDGVISARNAEIGQVLAVDDTRPLFRVTSLSPLLARIFLPQWAYSYLHEGDRVILRPDGSPAPAVTGRVHWINDVLDAASGSAEVLVEAGAGRDTLRPGMSVTVEVSLRLPPGRLTVSRLAFRETSENALEGEVTVRRADGDEVRRVRAGFKGKDRVEILLGIEAGETVVLRDDAAPQSGWPPPARR